MITAEENSKELSKILAEGRSAKEDGRQIHENPYDYRFEAIAANAWDDGWKGRKS